MQYTIKSNYVKNLIKDQSFDNEEYRAYILDLIFLERSLTEGIGGWSGNMKLFGLKKQYSSEYESIYKELKPAEFEVYSRDKKIRELQNRKEIDRYKKKQQQELEQLKQWWINYGGKA